VALMKKCAKLNKIGYDTGMADSGRDSSWGLASADTFTGAGAVPEARPTVRFRSLPDGAFRETPQLGWKGRILEIDLQGQDLPLGTPLEIESAYMVYLGELCQRDGPVGSVQIEHSLDRAKLAADRDHWG
jgi:hypothetical protein